MTFQDGLTLSPQIKVTTIPGSVTHELWTIPHLFQETFRGKTFQACSIGTDMPAWMAQTFSLERELRERWWDVQPGDVVLDLGAAYGSYTLCSLAAGAAMVVAFEPGKDMLYDLTLNIAVNGWMDRLIVVPAMAGRSPGLLPYWPASHSIQEEGEREFRLVVPVDNVLLNAPRLDWIKVDVDGCEVDAVAGCLGLIRKHRPCMLTENHVGIVPDVCERLRELLLPLGYNEENYVRPEGGLNDNWSLWVPK